MGVIYLISLLVLFLSFILVKKSDRKIDIISSISIGVVTIFCYNTFICYILTFFVIPVKLSILTVINLIVSCVFVFLTAKNKQVQKYSFERIDLLYIALIILVVLFISYLNFGFPFNIKYETGDPSVHYLTSIMFAESETLLAGTEGDYVYGSFNTRKTTSYVNSGLIMKSICKDLNAISCYNVFVIFGIITLTLTGITIFSSLTHFAKNKEQRLWAFLLSLICILGYPLNSFLFGFEYLSMGLLVICAILCLVYYYKNERIEFKYFVILMFLLNFGLFCSYYMFVPFIYPALWIYFCIENYNNTKKVITKELVVLLLVTLLIPFVLGYIYHIAPNIYGVIINNFSNIDKSMELSSYLVNSGLAVNGYIYINLYSNMLLLIPLAIYFFIKKAKERELKKEVLLGLLLAFNILFIEILLIGNKFGKVSMYYLSKNYFVLWILLIYCNYKALVQLAEKDNYLPRLFISFYIILMIICTMFSNAKMINALSNPNENVLTVMEIFGVNKDILINKPCVYDQQEMELLMYARNNLNYNKKIEVVSDDTTWTYAMLRYINKEKSFEGKKSGESYLVSKWLLLPQKINKVNYIIYFNKSKMYNSLKDKLFENAEIIYENPSGGILKYNNKEE